MPKLFHELRERLLQAGIAPRYVRRYLAELADHLVDLRAEEERAGRSRADAESAALARLGGTDELVKAMIGHRQFQSWSVRVPWAIFGLGPLVFLAVAYFVACLYLWVLWQVFLPGADTPFGHGNPGPVYGFQNICIQTGKFYYIGAPILVGWAILLLAARHRVMVGWPIVGSALVALMGATAQIHASRTAVPDRLGHISMSFTVGSSLEGLHGQLLYALVIFSFTVLPYLFWRLQKLRSLSG